MKFFIKTFGCQQNHADSVRITSYLKAQGMKPAKSYKTADYIVINTCMIRESAENRVYGLVNNLQKLKTENHKLKIVVTGCMSGMAVKDKTGKYLKLLKQRLPGVDEFIPIDEIGFDTSPLTTNSESAFVPISNGCNNFCTYCVVPYTRGREKSLPFKNIIEECRNLKKKGYKNVTLLGQNVNSYGSDIIASKEAQKLKPIYVKHLGKLRIPTLFPYLLEDVAKIGFEKVDFMSSNPWDFSDELIDVIAKNKNITRTIHLPVQSGDDAVLKRMNRWYSADEYLVLISKIKNKISNIKFTTDIIVGFCGETDEEFKNTVKLCKKVGFSWAFVSVYSKRPMAAASNKIYEDNVPHVIKDKRWKILDDLINKPHLKKKIK
ncbi:MAG: MiaB/RimO family radical SAM methylthiotransferase [Patescibacteria group bacterium]|jgi:tRNA-2-methylthio-N6-dimethylallyladenosine synthase